MTPHILYNKYRLLTPGPVPVPPEVLQIFSKPLIHHRTNHFASTLKEVLKKLQDVFQTRQPVLIQTATGTGLMEVALVNTLSPGDKVLVVNAGKFGQRWVNLSRALNLQPIEIKVPLGQSICPAIVQKYLCKKTKAILIQGTETSTGALHPIQQIAQLIEGTETLLIVDGIAALAVEKLPMDLWGLDVLIGAGHKAFMLPPGIGFVALSQRAWHQNQKNFLSRFYWDLKAEHQANQKGQTRFTSAIPHIQALHWILHNHKLYPKQHYIKIAQTFKAVAPHLGFQIFPQNPSLTLTVFTLKNWHNSSGQYVGANAIKDHLYNQYRMTIASGQGELNNKVLRIGHIGHIQNEDILAVIQALAETMQHFGFVVHPEKALKTALKNLPIK